MTAEQLMEELYRLIYDTQSISPMADVRVITEFDNFKEIKMEMYETSYRELIIEVS